MGEERGARIFHGETNRSFPRKRIFPRGVSQGHITTWGSELKEIVLCHETFLGQLNGGGVHAGGLKFNVVATATVAM